MKKIIILITIITTFLLTIPKVYALDVDIEEIKILDKNDNITIDNITADNLTLIPKITFNEVNDYVIFKVIFKGKDINKYEILKISDNNKSENIRTSYKYDKTLEKPLYITMVYENGSDKETTINNINIIMELVGEGEKEKIVLNSSQSKEQTVSNNPGTGTISRIVAPLVLIVISVLLINYYTKYKDNSNLMVLILFLISIPITVMAYESQKLTLTIKTDKIIVAKSNKKTVTETPKVYKVYLYPNGGTGIKDGYTFEYTETTLFNKFPKVTKDKCTLSGWNIDSPSGTAYYTDVRPSDDGKKLYARWNCNNLDFNIRVTKSASYELHQDIDVFLKSKGSSLAEYNAYIKQKVNEAGMSTREGVIAAALATIYYLYDNYDTKLPYYWGGSSFMSYGIHPYTGRNIPSDTYYPMPPRGYPYPYVSFDCTGFTSWAIKNGGYDFARTAGGFVDIAGPKNTCNIKNSSCVGKPGDFIFYMGEHIKMIVKVDEANNTYYTAEATTSGVIVSTMGMHQAGSVETVVLNFDDYYNNSSHKKAY